MGENPGNIELSNMKNGPPEQAKLRRRRRRRTCFACCGACSILLILIVVVLVILAFTVFKPKKPRMHVDRITIEGFHADILINIPPTIKLNVTLGVVVSVTNPNKLGFKYYNSTTYMFYRDEEVGIVPIPAGELGAGKTAQIASTIDLLADRLITDTQVYADFFAGSLPFSTHTDISGRVNILHIFKHHVDTSSVCNMNISSSGVLKDMVCTYDIDF